MNIIEVQNLNKIYNQHRPSFAKTALDNVSFSVQKGSFTAVLGMNGAGKSTLLNILSGLDTKTSGSIMFENLDLDKDKDKIKKKIGVVPQEIALNVFLNVKETLNFFAGLYGCIVTDKEIDLLLDNLGLLKKKYSPIRALSTGMKRRLMVAKALIHDPEIIFLDEPTAGVDIEMRAALWCYIKSLQNKGKTMILTTHYMEEVEELCDNLVAIKDGRLVASGSKDGLMKKYFNQDQLKIECSKILKKHHTLFNEIKGLEISNNVIFFNSNDTNIKKVFKIIDKEKIQILSVSEKKFNIEDLMYLVSSDKM